MRARSPSETQPPPGFLKQDKAKQNMMIMIRRQRRNLDQRKLVVCSVLLVSYVGIWCRDYAHAATYYKHLITQETRWASVEDPVSCSCLCCRCRYCCSLVVVVVAAAAVSTVVVVFSSQVDRLPLHPPGAVAL